MPLQLSAQPFKGGRLCVSAAHAQGPRQPWRVWGCAALHCRAPVSYPSTPSTRRAPAPFARLPAPPPARPPAPFPPAGLVYLLQQILSAVAAGLGALPPQCQHRLHQIPLGRGEGAPVRAMSVQSVPCFDHGSAGIPRGFSEAAALMPLTGLRPRAQAGSPTPLRTPLSTPAAALALRPPALVPAAAALRPSASGSAAPRTPAAA
jgi:hypothetical protein